MEMAFQIHQAGALDLLIWLHTDVDPAPGEWQLSYDAIHAFKAKRGSTDSMCNLVLTDGGAPGAEQRAYFHKVLDEGQPRKYAVLSVSLSNPLKRGVATAIHWLNPAFQAWEPKDYEKALAHLGLAGKLPELWPVLLALQGKLRPTKTLAKLATVAGLSLLTC